MSRSCPACGAEVSAAAKFCRGCGTAVPADPPVQQADTTTATTRTCGSCGGSLVSEARFCHLCGSATPSVDPADALTTVLEQESAATVTGQTVMRSSSSVQFALQGGEAATIVSRESHSSPASGVAGQPICPSCRAATSAGARFCRACGAQLDGPSPATVTALRSPTVCPNCQAQVETWASFCRHCGWSLSPGGSAVPSPMASVEGACCKVCNAPKTGPGELCSQCEQAMGA
jgi:predicted amidophosphoribosyltransferase